MDGILNEKEVYFKGLIDPNDKKTKVKMTIKDFDNDTENYYGIENISDLVNLITSGITIEEACIDLGLNDEQKAIEILILAREYYLQVSYAIGD